MTAGKSDGESASDSGGTIKLSAGSANGGYGGSISLSSGGSSYESSK